MLNNFHTSPLASGNSELFSTVLTVCYFVTNKLCIRDLSLLEFEAQNPAIPTGNHCTGQGETTAVLLIYVHTWGMSFWGSPQCGLCLFYAGSTQSRMMVLGMVRASCSLADRESYVTPQL